MEVQTKSSSDSNITLCPLISPLIITFTDHEPTTNVCLHHFFKIKQSLFNTFVLKAVSHSNPFHYPVNRDRSHPLLSSKLFSLVVEVYFQCIIIPARSYQV